MANAKQLTKLIQDAGFSIVADEDGLRLIPDRLRVDTLKVDINKRGQWITDPERFPEERKEENIFWTTDIDVTAILQGGEEATIYLMNRENQLILNNNVEYPEGF